MRKAITIALWVVAIAAGLDMAYSHGKRSVHGAMPTHGHHPKVIEI